MCHILNICTAIFIEVINAEDMHNYSAYIGK